MIKSMTAFARETHSGPSGELTWELRSVNHRFLEPHIRLPEELRALEPAVRDLLAARLARGKVDCTLRYSPAVGVVGSLSVNRAFVEQLLAAGDQNLSPHRPLRRTLGLRSAALAWGDPGAGAGPGPGH